MRKNGLLFSLFSMLLLAFIVVGCSSKSGEEGSGSNNPDGEDVFVFARGGDAVSLDPSEVTDSESENVTLSILETLVTFADGELLVEPQLATDWEESDDGLTYTLKLREDVKFHDGTDFNSDAVVYNFERWMNAQDLDRFYMYGSVFG